MYEANTQQNRHSVHRDQSDNQQMSGLVDEAPFQALVFGSFMHITGRLPIASEAGHPVEYRVAIGTSDRNDAADGTLSWRIVGAGSATDRALLASTRVGRFAVQQPFHSLDVLIGADDVDTSGWLNVVEATYRRYAADARLLKREIERLRWVPDGVLMTVDISCLGPDVRRLLVRIDIRQVLDPDTDHTAPMSGSGTMLEVHVDR